MRIGDNHVSLKGAASGIGAALFLGGVIGMGAYGTFRVANYVFSSSQEPRVSQNAYFAQGSLEDQIEQRGNMTIIRDRDVVLEDGSSKSLSQIAVENFFTDDDVVDKVLDRAISHGNSTVRIYSGGGQSYTIVPSESRSILESLGAKASNISTRVKDHYEVPTRADREMNREVIGELLGDISQ